jgi:ribonuclease P protein component
VLAKANRLVRAEDFKTVTRSGARFATTNTVVYLNLGMSGTPARFGFIVTKSVGSAVVRNLVRRRLRAITRELVNRRALQADIVIRALPGSRDLSWRNLHAEVSGAIEKGAARQ